MSYRHRGGVYLRKWSILNHFAFQLDSCQPRRVKLSLGSEVEAAPALGLRASTLDLNDSCSCTFQPSRSICCSFFPPPFFSLKRPFFFHPSFLHCSFYGSPHTAQGRRFLRCTIALPSGAESNETQCLFFPPSTLILQRGRTNKPIWPRQSFLNNLSPHYCIHDTQTVFPFKGQGGVSFLICFKMNAFSGSCARNTKKINNKLPSMEFLELSLEGESVFPPSCLNFA